MEVQTSRVSLPDHSNNDLNQRSRSHGHFSVLGFDGTGFSVRLDHLVSLFVLRLLHALRFAEQNQILYLKQNEVCQHEFDSVSSA